MTGSEDFTVDSIEHDDDMNALIDGLVEYFQGLLMQRQKEIGAPFSDIESQGYAAVHRYPLDGPPFRKWITLRLLSACVRMVSAIRLLCSR